MLQKIIDLLAVVGIFFSVISAYTTNKHLKNFSIENRRGWRSIKMLWGSKNTLEKFFDVVAILALVTGAILMLLFGYPWTGN